MLNCLLERRQEKKKEKGICRLVACTELRKLLKIHNVVKRDPEFLDKIEKYIYLYFFYKKKL